MYNENTKILPHSHSTNTQGKDQNKEQAGRNAKYEKEEEIHSVQQTGTSKATQK